MKILTSDQMRNVVADGNAAAVEGMGMRGREEMQNAERRMQNEE